LPTFHSSRRDYPHRESQHTVSQLIENIEGVGAEPFAYHILNNLQRTSAVSGILKSEAVYLWAKVFKAYGIEVFQDIAVINKNVENEILKIKGQKSGISLTYFYMLSGNDNFCKPDRHVLKFLSEGLQREIKDFSEAQAIMRGATVALKEKHPHLTTRMLDHTMWAYMSSRNKK